MDKDWCDNHGVTDCEVTVTLVARRANGELRAAQAHYMLDYPVSAFTDWRGPLTPPASRAAAGGAR